MPRLMILCGGRDHEAPAPSKLIEPDVGGNVPESMLKIVLLPEPFGPIRPRISPRSTFERDVADGFETAKPLYQSP